MLRADPRKTLVPANSSEPVIDVRHRDWNQIESHQNHVRVEDLLEDTVMNGLLCSQVQLRLSNVRAIY